MRNLEDSHLRKTRQGGNHRALLGQESRVNQSHRLAVVLLLNVTEEKNNLRIRTNITLLAMGIVLEEDLLLCLWENVNPVEVQSDGMEIVDAHKSILVWNSQVSLLKEIKSWVVCCFYGWVLWSYQEYISVVQGNKNNKVWNCLLVCSLLLWGRWKPRGILVLQDLWRWHRKLVPQEHYWNTTPYLFLFTRVCFDACVFNYAICQRYLLVAIQRSL